MPAYILTGPISVNTPEQDAFGVVIGNNSMSNWDANMKFNTAIGGDFGVGSLSIQGSAVMFDNLEVVDGVINEHDIKSSPSAQF